MQPCNKRFFLVHNVVNLKKEKNEKEKKKAKLEKSQLMSG